MRANTWKDSSAQRQGLEIAGSVLMTHDTELSEPGATLAEVTAAVRTRLAGYAPCAAAGAGVVAGGVRLAAGGGATALPGRALLTAAGAAAGLAPMLELLPAMARATLAGTGAGAGAMGYGDATGMPMRARSGCALLPLADPLVSGVITATICN